MQSSDDLTNRDVRPANMRPRGRPSLEPLPTAQILTPNLNLANRIAQARAVKVPAKGIHCGCCFGQGRDAAILAMAPELAERARPSGDEPNLADPEATP